MGWKDTARRSMVGDRTPLNATGGELWIRPKKLSQAAVDGIREERARSASSSDFRDAMRRAMRLREKYPGLFEGRLSDAAIDPDDQGEILELFTTMRAGPQVAIYRIELLHGIGEHNFVDDAGAPLCGGKVFDEKAVEEILDWGELAAEIVAVVEAYNRPLAATQPGTSRTSQSGSSGGPGSPPSPEPSPTAAAP